MPHPLLEVRDVWKRLCRRPEKALRYALADIAREVRGASAGRTLREGEFWALQDVAFDVLPGEVLGVIGHNGAGKSTLINIVSGIILPTLGSVNLRTDRVAVIDHGGGLNPIETGRENAITQLAIHGVPPERIPHELAAIEAFAEIGDFLDALVGTYSLGMRLRLAFSIYTRLSPDLFVIDEALGGGDLRFRNKFRSFLRSYIDGGGTILLCSHDMGAVQAFCDRCILLDRGRVVMSGPPVSMIDSYYELNRRREAEEASTPLARAAAAGDLASPAPMLDRCIVEKIGISAADGGDIRPGSPVVIEVALAVREAISGVAVFVEIGRGENPAIATLSAGYPAPTITISPPRMTLSFHLDRLPFAPGSHELRVAVSLPHSAETVATRGYYDLATVFAVVPTMSAVANITSFRENIVHVESKWHITAHEAASPQFAEAGDRDDSVMPSEDSTAQ